MKQSRLILPTGRVAPLARLGRALASKAYADAKFFLIVDENTYAHCLPEVVARVAAFEQAEFVEVPVGEECKSIEIAAQVWQTMLDSDADTNTVVVSLGGGAVCDLGGFVAAGYKRGVRHINIPTTLIAMADAAIGGKTAVDLGGVKNPVGFFKMPDIVCVDTSFLDTLPDAEVVAGAFEVVKTAAVADADLFRSLVDGASACASAPVVARVAEIKQAVVGADPNDHGIRHILNFGHTFGHAVEAHRAAVGKPVSHGVAVGIGMALALRLSVLKLGFPRDDYDSYCRFLTKYVDFPRFTLRDTESLLALMRNDKKNRGGEILAVLMQRLGEPVINIALSDNEIRDTFLRGMAL